MLNKKKDFIKIDDFQVFPVLAELCQIFNENWCFGSSWNITNTMVKWKQLY